MTDAMIQWQHVQQNPRVQYHCYILTSFRQEFDGLQDTLSVDPRFVVFHLSINDVDHAGSSSTNGSSSSIKSVHISLLQGNYTFVNVLKDVVLWRKRTKSKPYFFLPRKPLIYLELEFFSVKPIFLFMQYVCKRMFVDYNISPLSKCRNFFFEYNAFYTFYTIATHCVEDVTRSAASRKIICM